MRETKVEVLQKEGLPGCYTANGYLVCYCGNCQPEDYKLPTDFRKIVEIKTDPFKNMKYEVKVDVDGIPICQCCRMAGCQDPYCDLLQTKE